MAVSNEDARIIDLANRMAEGLFLQLVAPAPDTLRDILTTLEEFGYGPREKLEGLKTAELVGMFSALLALHGARGMVEVFGSYERLAEERETARVLNERMMKEGGPVTGSGGAG